VASISSIGCAVRAWPTHLPHGPGHGSGPRRSRHRRRVFLRAEPQAGGGEELAPVDGGPDLCGGVEHGEDLAFRDGEGRGCCWECVGVWECG